MQGGATMAVEEYSWFLIQCRWDWDRDDKAMDKFGEVFDYLSAFKDPNLDLEKCFPDDDPRRALEPGSLKALNLIGKRNFVIIGRTKNNEPLQKLSAMITLTTGIMVDVYPATDVMEFKGIKPWS
jgi:hypothetical protein